MSYAMLSRKSAAAPAAKTASKAESTGLRIGEANDSFEQEADRVADEVVRGDGTQLGWSLSKMSVGAPLQRKCSCGGSSGSAGECEECKKKETLQRRAADSVGPSVAPPIVHQVLNSPGRPLDQAARNFFEPRFGRDFSKVRIHADSEAGASARAVHARAYAVGSSVVFGEGEYRPQTEAGRHLIAHELAHTLQQRPTLARDSLGQPPTPSPSGAGGPSLYFRPPTGSPLSAIPAATPPPQVPPRGPNPADCMKPLCQKLSKLRPPTTAQKTLKLGNDWLTNVTACISGGASASNASHSAEIVANEQGEMRDELKVLNDGFAQDHDRDRFEEYVKNLSTTCEHKLRQVFLEFHYNVIFENPAGASLKWGYNPDWNEVEGALSALPVEATWGNPHVLRFRREACHPSDVDKTTGQCTGHGGGFVGGQTEPAAGGADRITIYDRGLGKTPYSRSAGLGVSTTSQTIRHEVGHVIDELIPPAELKNLFDDIMHWHVYPWDWVIANGTGLPQSWQDERHQLMRDTAMNSDQLDKWLAGLGTNVPVMVNGITYSKAPKGAGFMLNAYLRDQMPQGVEFEYARTDHGEYIAELYALAVSAPEFLSSALPAVQSAWLRRVVFHTPEDPKALAQQAALAEPGLTEFLIRGSRLYTREQLDGLLAELAARYRHPGSQLA